MSAVRARVGRHGQHVRNPHRAQRRWHSACRRAHNNCNLPLLVAVHLTHQPHDQPTLPHRLLLASAASTSSGSRSSPSSSSSASSSYSSSSSLPAASASSSSSSEPSAARCSAAAAARRPAAADRRSLAAARAAALASASSRRRCSADCSGRSGWRGRAQREQGSGADHATPCIQRLRALGRPPRRLARLPACPRLA